MTTERHKPNREQAVQPSSLRDYWLKPTGYPADKLPELTRRTALSVITPSLWEQPPLLSTLAASTSAPGDEGTQAVSTLSPQLEAADVSENTMTPHSAHFTERLQRRGVSLLSDAELLAIVLRADQGRESVSPNLQTLLTSYSVRQLFSVDFGELCEQFGFGEAKAAQLQATLEVARRLLLPTDKEKYTIQSPQDAAALVRAEMEFLDHEELRVLVLNTKNQVEANLLLYQGTINSSVLRAAEIFRPAITRKCPNIIICHNHPSGDPTPSPVIWRKICQG